MLFTHGWVVLLQLIWSARLCRCGKPISKPWTRSGLPYYFVNGGALVDWFKFHKVFIEQLTIDFKYYLHQSERTVFDLLIAGRRTQSSDLRPQRKRIMSWGSKAWPWPSSSFCDLNFKPGNFRILKSYSSSFQYLISSFWLWWKTVSASLNGFPP